MLDYDGTLAPFARDRFRALPYPGVMPRLEELASLHKVRVVLVTGRPARELQELVKTSTPLEIWGSHGREQITAGGEYHLQALAPEQAQALDAICAELRKQTSADALERKPASLAVHWRALAPEAQKSLQASVVRLYSEKAKDAGLDLLGFDGGLEIRSEAVNKGHAVERILRVSRPEGSRAGYRVGTVAYLGDDTTDEDAFLALRKHGLTVLVRDEWRQSAAEYWIRPPLELLAFLDRWIAAARLGEP